MKKVLSFICALSMAATMFVGLATTASADDKVVAGLKFNGYTYNETYAEYEPIVECIVTIPGTLSKYVSNRGTITGRALQSMAINATYPTDVYAGYNDDAYKATNKVGVNNTAITITSEGDLVWAWIESTSTSNYYYGDSKFSMGTVKLTLTDPDKAGTVTFTSSGNGVNLEGAVREQLVQSNFKFGTYDANDNFTEGMTLAIPSYNEWANPAPSVEVATSGAWKTDKGLLVIGKVTGEYTEKGITVDGYVTPEVARDPGVGPNFVATAPASAQGYYGVLIKGIAAGSYTVNAYVDTVKGATTSVTID